jgi:hypothetical protein
LILVGSVAAHVFPLGYLMRRSQIMLYVGLAIAAAWGFGITLYFAEVDDPFRSENELGSNIPFWTAFLLSIFPVLRSVLRVTSFKLRPPASPVTSV